MEKKNWMKNYIELYQAIATLWVFLKNNKKVGLWGHVIFHLAGYAT